jgi:hypothetical protein
MILRGNLLPYLRLKTLSTAVPVKQTIRWILCSSPLQRQPVNLQRVLSQSLPCMRRSPACLLAGMEIVGVRERKRTRKKKKKGREKIKNEGK